MTTDVEVIAKSVTKDNYADNPRAGVLNIMLGDLWTQGRSQLPLDLPPYWSWSRDDILSQTPLAEDMWSAAVSKTITKIAAQGWSILDSKDSKFRTERAQRLLLLANLGRGWVEFIEQHLADYLTTDNGAFIEVVWNSLKAGTGRKVIGLCHLDSWRCMRTGDLDRPIIYRDRKQQEHELLADQVLMFADMPDPREMFNGTGHCAASRVYRTIVKLAAMERYITEKLTGSRVTEIEFVDGINIKQLEDAVAMARAGQAQKGYVYWMGKLYIPAMSDKVVSGYTSKLAEVPDGFNAKEERDNAYVKYANALGIPVQDIQPLSGQGLGTGTQSIILDEAANSYGLAAWRKDFTQKMNELILPDSTTFSFATNDIRDQKAKAEVQKLRADTRAVQVNTGEITADQALQLAVDSEDVPAEFLQQADMTPGGTLQDDEKPLTDEVVEQPVAPEASVPIATKEMCDVQVLMKQELDRARQLYATVVQ